MRNEETVNSSRIVKFAAAAFLLFFPPSSIHPRFFDPDSLTLGFIGWFLYLFFARAAPRAIPDENEDDRGAKIHPSVVPHNFFAPPVPFFSSPPPPGNRLHACFTPAVRQRNRNRCKCTLRTISLTPSLSLSLSFSRSHALTFFSVPSSPIFPRDVSGKGPVGPVRLTRVLFDYYFSTYRALVTSLCGHMVVGGWRVSRETKCDEIDRNAQHHFA